MAGKACSDTGPVLHLHEIGNLSLTRLFSKVFISHLVEEELQKRKIKLPGNFEIESVNKDQVALLSNKYGIDPAEASVIWLCKSLQIPLLLTDDLDAREASAQLGIKAVGTIGIIIRCYREKRITRTEAARLLKLLSGKSTLFITSELINYAIEEINKFKP